MDWNLKGRVVAISGGTSGIGEAIALAYAREGCKVAVCGRNPEKLAHMHEQFDAEELHLFSLTCDVSVNADLKRFVEGVVDHYGRLDVFVNNAGTAIRKPFYTLTEEEWYKVVNTNQKSVFFGCAYAAEEMRKTGGGVIINTSSFTARIPTAGSAVYASTKAAVDQMTKVFAAELAADNIRVVGVLPGMTVTPLTATRCERDHDKLVSQISQKRLGVPEDMIGAYLFFASDYAAYITGESIAVSGGKLVAQNPHYSYQTIKES